MTSVTGFIDFPHYHLKKHNSNPDVLRRKMAFGLKRQQKNLF
jgi:hypothetical protein